MGKKSTTIQYARVCTWEGKNEEESGDIWILLNSFDSSILREALKEYATPKRKKALDLFKRMEDLMLW